MKFIIDPKIKHRIRLISWTAFAVLVGISITSLFLNGSWYKEALHLKANFSSLHESKKNTASVVQVIAGAKVEEAVIKSQYYYINKDTNGGPKVSAKAFLVGDLNTGEVILSKNQDEKFPIASVSKLMTALVAKQIMKPNDTVKISKTALATEGTNGELHLGQKIQISNLLYPLLLESSNDAAEAIAEYFNRDNFISKMNEAAQSLKMSSTSYGDPSGLSKKNQSTASDLFKLTGYLVQNNPDLIKITTYRSYSDKKQSWSNISQFLSDDGYQGGKSGYTDAALQTDVAIYSLPLAQTDSRPVAITILQSTDRHKDIETILKYLNKNIYYGGPADANTNWVAEKIGIPEIKDPDYVTMAFAGDIMLDRGVKSSVTKNFDNDYSALFANSKGPSEVFKKSDIAFANLEGTASDQGKDIHNLYSFRMTPDVIPALKGAGVSILSVANNHIGDWGLPAFTDTLAHLKENEILYTGGGMNKMEAESPTVIEKYGMKIGFLGFSDVGPNNMAADSGKAGVLLTNNPDFDQIIKNAAKQVDYLIISFHFGVEYQAKHNARQEHLAHEAIDDGAKIIIGTHPHMAEDTEVYKNGFIAYSLGNLIFDQSFSADTMQGMLLEIKLNKDGSMTVKKDTTKLNSAFQLEKVIQGKEEKIKFPNIQPTITQTASTL